MKKHFNRVKVLADQTVGRAEKTELLSNELVHVDNRVECFLSALQKTRNKLNDCLRSRSSQDNYEKRKKKLEEYALVQVLLSEAKLLGEPSLLGQVMQDYGEALSAVVDELVTSDMEIERRVLDRFTRYSEEQTQIHHLKSKLKNLILDMDSAKSRLTNNTNPEKSQTIQEEYDESVAKVDNCKDNLAADMYTLSAKEVEMASIFTVLMETQLEYHKTALAVIEDTLPKVARKIASFGRRPVYGCPLEDHLRYSGRDIALVLEVCCAALVDLGLKDEGIFRISGNSIKVRKLKAGFDAGEIDLTDYGRDPHSIAGALKSYLRELPDPLMSHNLYKEWMNCAKFDGKERLEKLKSVIAKLPSINYDNLRYLVHFMHELVNNQTHNKMTSSNIAIVMGPNMMWSPLEDSGFAASNYHAVIVEALVNNANTLFPGEIQFTSKLIASLHNDTGGFGGGLVGSDPPSNYVLNRIAFGSHLGGGADSNQKNDRAFTKTTNGGGGDVYRSGSGDGGSPPELHWGSGSGLDNGVGGGAVSCGGKATLPGPGVTNLAMKSLMFATKISEVGGGAAGNNCDGDLKEGTPSSPVANPRVDHDHSKDRSSPNHASMGGAISTQTSSAALRRPKNPAPPPPSASASANQRQPRPSSHPAKIGQEGDSYQLYPATGQLGGGGRSPGAAGMPINNKVGGASSGMSLSMQHDSVNNNVKDDDHDFDEFDNPEGDDVVEGPLSSASSIDDDLGHAGAYSNKQKGGKKGGGRDGKVTKLAGDLHELYAAVDQQQKSQNNKNGGSGSRNIVTHSPRPPRSHSTTPEEPTMVKGGGGVGFLGVAPIASAEDDDPPSPYYESVPEMMGNNYKIPHPPSAQTKPKHPPPPSQLTAANHQGGHFKSSTPPRGIGWSTHVTTGLDISEPLNDGDSSSPVNGGWSKGHRKTQSLGQSLPPVPAPRLNADIREWEAAEQSVGGHSSKNTSDERPRRDSMNSKDISDISTRGANSTTVNSMSLDRSGSKGAYPFPVVEEMNESRGSSPKTNLNISTNDNVSTKDGKVGKVPLRPPLPSKDVLARHSSIRNSIGKSSSVDNTKHLRGPASPSSISALPVTTVKATSRITPGSYEITTANLPVQKGGPSKIYVEETSTSSSGTSNTITDNSITSPGSSSPGGDIPDEPHPTRPSVGNADGFNNSIGGGGHVNSISVVSNVVSSRRSMFEHAPPAPTSAATISPTGANLTNNLITNSNKVSTTKITVVGTSGGGGEEVEHQQLLMKGSGGALIPPGRPKPPVPFKPKADPEMSRL